MWTKESNEFKDFIIKNSERYIEMPVSPSAEAYSLMFLYVIDKIVQATEFNNGEKEVEVHSVRVHETTTGYAESFRDDLEWWDFNLEDVIFSDGIKSEWKDPQMYDKLIEATNNGTKYFINDKVVQQV
jgi:6-pyruvoyltetrahydropterin/6-carboxytetrahydropterin synthase